MPPSRASTAAEVYRVVRACYHGDIQRFEMMTVDVGVFIILRWVHSVGCEFHQRILRHRESLLYVSEFSGYIKRLVRPSYELLL